MNAWPPADKLFELGFGFAVSKVFLSAVELGVFTELNRAGALDCEELGARLKIAKRGARDFFDALVAMGLLERHDGRFANTPISDIYLVRGKPTYIGGLFEMANARLYGFWGALSEALRTGLPQNEIKHGENLFDALYSDPSRLRLFLSAMTGLSLASAEALALKFPWQQYRTFIDVGCAQGCVPVRLALAHDHLRGGGFDLTEVGTIFNDYVQAHGLAERLCFYAGNFLAEPLPSADVLIMGHILHDWDLDTKLMLLRKAHSALPTGGALIVYEHMIDGERRQNLYGLLMSLNMLIETTGGFDYTWDDLSAWMKDVGFAPTPAINLWGPQWMVVGHKV